MKKTVFFFCFLLIKITLLAQSNQQQNPSKYLLGKYEGYQKTYSMGQIYGRDIIVPGSTYSFKLSAGNKIKLYQVADDGTSASYSGRYIVSSKSNSTTLTCQMIEDGNNKYPSKPKFFIKIDKLTNVIICQQNTDHTPSFELKKINSQ